MSQQLDIILTTSFIRDGAIIANLFQWKGVSILENSTLAGLKVPTVIKNVLEVLNKDGKKDE